MRLSERDLAELVAKASPLAERLGGRIIPDASQATSDLVSARLERWCRVVAQGNRERFEKRLAWDGIDETAVRQALAGGRLAHGQPFPPWSETLQEVIEAAVSVSTKLWEDGEEKTYRFLDRKKPVPFEEVFVPFIRVAQRKLSARAGSSSDLLSEAAHVSFERHLLGGLAYLGAQALELEFVLFRRRRQSRLAELLASSLIGTSQRLYRQFVDGLLADGLRSFFQEYSVLARLMATTANLWVDSSEEFLLRLEADWPDIRKIFCHGQGPGRVMEIRPGLSDPHNGGRSVMALTFASGLKLVYKPKDLGMEQAYFQLLAWLNERGIPLPFTVLKVLDRSTHGWVEYVEHRSCQSAEEARRYYERSGMLLCLVYALEGTDCIHENLIAWGEHPVLVDLETLLCHRARDIEAPGVKIGAQALANEQLWDSVLRTSLLPHWVFWLGGQAYDASGLGGGVEQEGSFQRLKWVDVNTDCMALEYETVAYQPGTNNVPTLDGVPLSPNQYVGELVDGFRHMYHFVLQHQGALLAPAGPVSRLSCRRVRVIVRDTRLYGYLLEESLHPHYLRDGADRSIELDVFSWPFLLFEAKPLFWPILEVERRALEQMDIPFFTARSDSDGLEIDPGVKIEQYFKEASHASVVARVNQLDEEDMERQIGFIRASLHARIAGRRGPSLVAEQDDLDPHARVPLTREEAVRQAVGIADGLRQRAIRAADGSASWIGLEYVARPDRYQLQPLGYSLYDGNCGVALFLAALEKVTGGAGFRDLALEAVEPLRQFLEDTNPEIRQRTTRQMSIGGAAGLGSVVYTLVRIGELLDAPALLEDARKIACLITPDLVARDHQLDIVTGAAGAVLGLLALYKASKDPEVLNGSVVCGRHLLESRVPSEAGPRAWKTLDGALLTGFSHGAAGIAYALLSLYQATGERAFLDAAKEAIDYENSVFSPEAGNWPNLRKGASNDGQLAFMTAWCHGAPGIGLARLGGLPMLDTPDIRRDIEVALKTTLALGLHGMDHLCCGNLGRVEFLLAAARTLSQAPLWDMATQRAEHVVAGAERRGSFRLGTTGESYVSGFFPGFFLGQAGIGYELLRLVHPDVLPSVLLWQ